MPDSESHVKDCIVSACHVEIFSACNICNELLCYNHFIDTGPCENDHKIIEKTKSVSSMKIFPSLKPVTAIPIENLEPEYFTVEGSQREEGTQTSSKRSKNKKKNGT